MISNVRQHHFQRCFSVKVSLQVIPICPLSTNFFVSYVSVDHEALAHYASINLSIIALLSNLSIIEHYSKIFGHSDSTNVITKLQHSLEVQIAEITRSHDKVKG